MPEATIKMTVPKAMAAYLLDVSPDARQLQNAMLLYPLVHSAKISHGKAAELLGMSRMDLISLYGSVGIPYFDIGDAELTDDIAALDALK